jgi:cellulose synthase (UDP-forming)
LSNSEDIWTTFLLHKNKWRTIFVNKVLAVGLAPDTIIPFFKQQRRWAKGGMEILLENNPLHSDSLELDQKIEYFISSSFFLVGIPILVYIVMPIIYLFFSAKPLLITDGAVWLLHYLPYFILYFALTWLLLGQKIRIATMATALASFYPYLLGFFSVVFSTEQQWVATESRKSNIDPIMKWIWPHILLLMLSVFSLIVGWYNMVEFWATFFNSLWVALNIFLLSTFLSKAKFS